MESSRKNKQMSKIEYLSMKMGSRIVALYQQNAGGDAQQCWSGSPKLNIYVTPLSHYTGLRFCLKEYIARKHLRGVC
jgi:hypothetical protein